MPAKKLRAVVLGACALAVAALPAVGMSGPPPTVVAQCTAVSGPMNDGVCLDQPPADSPPAVGPSVGTPWVGIGRTNSGGPGISTGPLFPGRTINIPLG